MNTLKPSNELDIYDIQLNSESDAFIWETPLKLLDLYG